MYVLTFEDHAATSLNEKHRTSIVYIGDYCDGVLLEIYLDNKFQWPQDGMNRESLASEVVA